MDKKSGRSEEAVLFQDAIEVTLGGKQYSIKLLRIREAREWRKQLATLIGALPSYANVTTEDPTAFEGAISAMMVTIPDKVTDLFFAYAKDLERESIEAEATDAEVAEAFKKVVAVAFPLARVLTETTENLSQ
jgi:hypothetical protein